MKLSTLTTTFVLLSVGVTFGQQNLATTDSAMIRDIFDEALVNGESYENLRSLCKDVGARLSGSPEAEKAVRWGQSLLKTYEFDSVYLQKITVPFWERGDVESATLNGVELELSALGGSVGTDGKLTAEVIEVDGLDEVAALGKDKIQGKIVFYNRPMDPRPISTFESYGGCVDQRYAGASIASQYGAVAVLVRSMTLLEDDHFPHTGSMGYKPDVTKIPAAALSTSSANTLSESIKSGKGAQVSLEMNCRTNPDVESFNVIAEIKGSQHPEKIIAVGGHLDSWDLGEGAHDDGAGIVHSVEVLRIMKTLNYQPKHTIRVVLFMNEENGNMGGKSYARYAKEANENHVAALESDRGGFSPRGFTIKGDSNQVKFIQSFKQLLEPYGLHYFENGYAGVDISPLATADNMVNPKILMMGLVPDSQRYFDFHHTDDDIFENVNKRELELGCASLTAMIYLLDNHLNGQL